MRQAITLGLAVLMLAGCMGGPPVRTVASDPEEMARRRAAVDRDIARRTAALERHRAAERQRAGQVAGGVAAPGPGRPGWDRKQQQADCVLRASRAQLSAGYCR